MAQSAEFLQLSQAHSDLITAIRQRQPQSVIERMCDACLETAVKMEPGLATFLSGRYRSERQIFALTRSRGNFFSVTTNFPARPVPDPIFNQLKKNRRNGMLQRLLCQMARINLAPSNTI